MWLKAALWQWNTGTLQTIRMKSASAKWNIKSQCALIGFPAQTRCGESFHRSPLTQRQKKKHTQMSWKFAKNPHTLFLRRLPLPFFTLVIITETSEFVCASIFIARVCMNINSDLKEEINEGRGNTMAQPPLLWPPWTVPMLIPIRLLFWLIADKWSELQNNVCWFVHTSRSNLFCFIRRRLGTI